MKNCQNCYYCREIVGGSVLTYWCLIKNEFKNKPQIRWQFCQYFILWEDYNEQEDQEEKETDEAPYP